MPVLILCGCSKSKVKPQDFTTYYSDKVATSIYNINSTASSMNIPSTVLAASTPDLTYANKYISLNEGITRIKYNNSLLFQPNTKFIMFDTPHIAFNITGGARSVRYIAKHTTIKRILTNKHIRAYIFF